MSLADDLKELKAALDSGAENPAEILGKIRAAAEKDHSSKLEGLLNELLDKMSASGNKEILLQGLDLLVSWHAGERGWKKTLKRRMTDLFTDIREWRVMANQLQLDKPILRPQDCLDRFHNLLAMTPGTLVYDKNWGVGEVRDLVLHEARVEVDFADKPGHLLAMSFAAESLERIDAEHLMARKQRDPEGLAALVKNNPAEVVKVAIRSFGPKTAPVLQDLLSPSIISTGDWKKFWDGARKGLKADPLVVLPSKRNEPITILNKEVDYGSGWFQEYAAKRNMAEILAATEEYLAERKSKELPEGAQEAVSNRLAFVVKGAGEKQYSMTVRALLLARELKMGPADVGAADFVERLFNAAVLLEFIAGLQARDVKGLFELLPDLDQERALATLIEALPLMPYGALCEAIARLNTCGRQTDIQAALSGPWNLWEAEGDVLYWIAVNPAKMREWNLGSSMDLASRLLKIVHREYNGERLRIQNQIRELFRNPEWLRPLLSEMDNRQQRSFTQSVKDATAWERLDKNSVLGQIVKISPEMGEIVSGRASKVVAEPTRGKVTSIRTFREKEAQLKKLVTRDIPENSREIALARSYGDLRENFEFKAAKDTQGLLMQRQADYEEALRTVTPTNFDNYPTDVAGMGTGVHLRYEDGAEATYYILGEWDGDASRQIISCGSALARAVEGKAPGETTMAPTEFGPRTCTVVEVLPLNPEIRAWIEHVPASVGEEALPPSGEEGAGEGADVPPAGPDA